MSAPRAIAREEDEIILKSRIVYRSRASTQRMHSKDALEKKVVKRCSGLWLFLECAVCVGAAGASPR